MSQKETVGPDVFKDFYHDLELLMPDLEMPEFDSNDPVDVSIAILQSDLSCELGSVECPGSYEPIEPGFFKSLLFRKKVQETEKLRRKDYNQRNQEWERVVRVTSTLDAIQLQALQLLASSKSLNP